ncbi:helix-turn-helix domain-containing protein [Streptomyces nymphaeiformis]|uniref:Transcriptional regulator with XRE-family HTH domain n=1 Tax=Streptomyces nymphaeiformis TaxID=2663842 RepID=A0A7W7XDN9_9ACTN|nr:helix-turn-helix transcriptional regulator [Streptomyces nymphaeiformis]MBB4984949.1 transcriptional regulator with XRE-family HTH domain [Streptomyces nymphaeiformis]
MSRIEFGRTGRAVAANVRRLRGERGLSLRGLAEALERHGRHLGEDALGKIERGARAGVCSGVRRVDVDDLAALAAVLEVMPAELLRSQEEDRGAAYGGSVKRVRSDG